MFPYIFFFFHSVIFVGKSLPVVPLSDSEIPLHPWWQPSEIHVQGPGGDKGTLKEQLGRGKGHVLEEIGPESSLASRIKGRVCVKSSLHTLCHSGSGA